MMGRILGWGPRHQKKWPYTLVTRGTPCRDPQSIVTTTPPPFSNTTPIRYLPTGGSNYRGRGNIINPNYNTIKYPYHPWDWYIYLHEWLIFMVNVGGIYTIHGSSGIEILQIHRLFALNNPGLLLIAQKSCTS